MKATDDDEEDDEQEFRQYKVILLGDGAVGKTSIANRFTDDRFAQTYKQTVGVDFFIRRLQLTPKLQVALQIWDIGGQSIGSKMITNYVAGAHAVLFCYDITNAESFANLEDWYRIASRTFDEDAMPFTVLVGNKCDLKHLAAVRSDSHSRFATENEMAAFLMSAKNGDQVNKAFWKIASCLAGKDTSRVENF
mmetsp:Transcript_16287/g.24544  ORF Transcript_16287/g.24544 Transcript_16287/m.24544 type:complete len:193 (-) Transcript_16287:265-843(-)